MTTQLDHFRAGRSLRGREVSVSSDGNWFQVYNLNNTTVASNAIVPWDTLSALNRWTYNAGVFTLTQAPEGIYSLSINTAQLGGVGNMILSVTCGNQNSLMVVPDNALNNSLGMQLILQSPGTITVQVQNITLGSVTLAGVISGVQQTVMYMSRSSF